MNGSFSDWATIAGGISGFFSFCYVLYEKLTSGPKIKSAVKSVCLYEREPSDSDLCFNYDFFIDVEIGNVGDKPISLFRPILNIEKYHISLNANFPGEEVLKQGSSSFLFEPGVANCFNFHFNYRSKKKLDAISFGGDSNNSKYILY